MHQVEYTRGTPAACITSASSVAVAGVSSDGFTTTAFAAGQRGRDLPRQQQQRQVPGVMMPTTPIGLRTA